MNNNKDFEPRAKCPYCKENLNLKDIHKETSGMGFLKQEIMYYCPYCLSILGFSRGKFTS
jgi:uncharacterized protein with PIN domain